MKKIVSFVLTVTLAISVAFVSVPSSNVEAATKAKSQKTIKLVTESYNPVSNSTTTYNYYQNGLLKKATTTYPAQRFSSGQRHVGSMGGMSYRSNIKNTTIKEYYYHTQGNAKGLLKNVVTTRNIKNEQYLSDYNASSPLDVGVSWADTYTVTSIDFYKYKKSTLKQIKSVTKIPCKPTKSNVEKHVYIKWPQIHDPAKEQVAAEARADKFLSWLPIETNQNDYEKVTTTRTFTRKASNHVIVKSKSSGDNSSTSDYYFDKKGLLTARTYKSFNAMQEPTFSSSYDYRYDKKDQIKKITVSTFSGFDHLSEGYINTRYLYFHYFNFSEYYYELPRYYFDNEPYINFGGEYYLNYVSNFDNDDNGNEQYECDYDSNIDQKVLLPANLIRLSSPNFKKAKVSSFYSQKVKDQQYKLLNQVNTINTFGL